MDKPLTVAILAGGLTHEREVSLHSGRRMAMLLRDAGVLVKILDVDARLLSSLDSMAPDLIWPLIHGSSGEDGSLQDILNLTGIPYLGSTPQACRLASNKAVAAACLEREGFRVPHSMTLPQALFRELGVGAVLDLIKARFTFPLVVKPAQGGSALGVTIVKEGAALPAALVDCFAYNEEARIEEFVAGSEIAVSVAHIGEGGAPVALPAVEIVTDGPYNYDARYNAGRSEYFVPARLTTELSAEVAELALRAHETLGLSCLSRTDMIVGADGTVWILDVNVAPGMTETSLFPQAMNAYAKEQGVPVEELYLSLLYNALPQE